MGTDPIFQKQHTGGLIGVDVVGSDDSGTPG